MNSFPSKIPIFPLNGVIFFPKTNLPLNIFEERYLNLVNDASNNDKLMGMIQLKRNTKEAYQVGCLGKITDLQKNKDGRILINLTGLVRFEIINEVHNSKLYREFNVDYNKFLPNLSPKMADVSLKDLLKKIKIFFDKSGLLLNWNEFDKLDQSQKINTLAMIAPITDEEKQKLLETITLTEKVKILSDITNFYLHEISFDNKTIQ